MSRNIKEARCGEESKTSTALPREMRWAESTDRNHYSPDSPDRYEDAVQPKERCTNPESYRNERDYRAKDARHSNQILPERLNAFQMIERIYKSLENLKCEHNALFCAIESALVSDNMNRCQVEESAKNSIDPYSQLVNTLRGIESSIDEMSRDVGSVCGRVAL